MANYLDRRLAFRVFFQNFPHYFYAVIRGTVIHKYVLYGIKTLGKE